MLRIEEFENLIFKMFNDQYMFRGLSNLGDRRDQVKNEEFKRQILGRANCLLYSDTIQIT